MEIGLIAVKKSGRLKNPIKTLQHIKHSCHRTFNGKGLRGQSG
jgi:hypothetical protein